MIFYFSIIGTILISLIYWLEKRELKAFFIFWYIVFLPTMRLLPEDLIKIPGFRFETFFGMGFLLLDFINQPKGPISLSKIYKKVKPAIIIFLLQTLFLTYQVVKTTIMHDPYKEEEENLALFILRHLFFFYVLLRMCYYMQDDYFRKTIIMGLSVGFILLGITSFLAPYLIKLGISIQGKYEYGFYRSAGVFRGHPTIFAGFMSAGFGFAFAFFIINKERIKKLFFLLVMACCLIGILNAASRAGIFGMVAIIIFYLIVEKQNFSSKSIIIFLIIAAGIWATFSFGDYMLQRFETTEQQLGGEENAMSRMATWMGHLYLFINNPQIWLFGLWGSVIVNGYILAPHSTPIKFLVYGGLPFFIIFYSYIGYLFRYYFKNREILNFNLLYPLIGYLLPSLMNDNLDIRYLPIILALALFNLNEIKLSLFMQSQFKRERKRKEIELSLIKQ